MNVEPPRGDNPNDRFTNDPYLSAIVPGAPQMPENLAPRKVRKWDNGIASFVLGMIGFVYWLALVVIAGLLPNNTSDSSPGNIGIGLFALLGICGNIVSAILAIVALAGSNTRRVFAVIGLTLNVFQIIAIIAIIVIGVNMKP